jgi:hypothetical protein
VGSPLTPLPLAVAPHALGSSGRRTDHDSRPLPEVVQAITHRTKCRLVGLAVNGAIARGILDRAVRDLEIGQPINSEELGRFGA